MSQTIKTASTDLFDALPDPAFAFDQEGTLTGANHAALSVLQVALADVLGHDCQVPARLIAGSALACRDENCPVMRMPKVRAASESGPSVERYTWKIGATDSGSVIVGRDVSELMSTVETQEVLLSTTAHELKTPLTSIKAMSELMLEFELPANKQRELTRDILAQAERLQRLINDILDVARMDSGRITYVPAQIDLVEISTRVIEDLRQTEARDREIEITAPPDLPRIIGEEGKVHQIVMNLTSNALKYSPMDARVDLRLRHDKEAGQVVLDVADHGVGITERDLPHIFSKFYRSENLKASRVPGTGLGLFIVRNLVELQGGRIDVTSERSSGSTFTVRLRAAEAAD